MPAFFIGIGFVLPLPHLTQVKVVSDSMSSEAEPIAGQL